MGGVIRTATLPPHSGIATAPLEAFQILQIRPCLSIDCNLVSTDRGGSFDNTLQHCVFFLDCRAFLQRREVYTHTLHRKAVIAEKQGVVVGFLYRLYFLIVHIMRQIIAETETYRHIGVSITQTKELLTANPPLLIFKLTVQSHTESLWHKRIDVIEYEVLVFGGCHSIVSDRTAPCEQIHEIVRRGKSRHYVLDYL